MQDWPNEIALQILRFCDFPTVLNVRQTCSTNKERVDFLLKRWSEFSFRSYQNTILDNCLYRNSTFSPSKMAKFFNKMPQLKSIMLVDLPCLLTLPDMIKLGNSVPNLEQISIVQNDHSFIDKDAFLGLTYFQSIKHLKVIGWEPSQIVRRGCVARFEVIPYQTLRKLTTLEIICTKNTISRVLHYVVHNEITMDNIQHVRFDIRHSSPDIPHLTMRFIASHPHLKTISFNGFLFTTQEQVAQFYQHLLTLPRLERLHLTNCSVIDRIENAIQKAFLDSLRKKGIQFNNIVNSLRHL